MTSTLTEFFRKWAHATYIGLFPWSRTEYIHWRSIINLGVCVAEWYRTDLKCVRPWVDPHLYIKKSNQIHNKKSNLGENHVLSSIYFLNSDMTWLCSRLSHRAPSLANDMTQRNFLSFIDSTFLIICILEFILYKIHETKLHTLSKQ